MNDAGVEPYGSCSSFEEPGVGGSRSESGYPALESEAFTAPGGLGLSTQGRQDAGVSQYAGRLDGGPSDRGRRPAKR